MARVKSCKYFKFNFPYSKEIGKEDISIFDIPKRADNALRRGGVYTVDQLLAAWDELSIDLERCKAEKRFYAMGRTTVKDIKSAVFNYVLQDACMDYTGKLAEKLNESIEEVSEKRTSGRLAPVQSGLSSITITAEDTAILKIMAMTSTLEGIERTEVKHSKTKEDGTNNKYEEEQDDGKSV